MERRVTSKTVAPIRVDTREDGARVLVGYGAVYYQEGRAGTEYQLWDNVYERIAPGAFDRAIRERHDARGLFNHNPDNLLGRVATGTMRLSADTEGLRYEIDLDPADPDHLRVLRKVERGDLSGSSFAFSPTKVEWSDAGDREIREIKDVDLYDTGPVTYPAYEGTSVAARAEHLVAEARSEHAAWKSVQSVVEGRQEIGSDDGAPTEVTLPAEASPAEAEPPTQLEATVADTTGPEVEPVLLDEVTRSSEAAIEETPGDADEKLAQAERERWAFKQRLLAASLWQ